MCAQPLFSSRFLTPSLAGMAGDDMVMAFVVRCPLGDQCSKKHGILAKKCTAEEARAALSWHLTSSPYHRLSEEGAENMAEETEVEEWPEPTGTTPQQQDEAPWQQSRKRQRKVKEETEVEQWPDVVALPVKTAGVRATDKVSINKVGLQACIDSLKRAKAAAESAQQLCAKAAQVFGNEASCIGNCQEVLETYLE